MSDSNIIPKWLSVGVIPLMNLFLAFCVSGLFIFFIGENPFRAIFVMIKGAFYYPGAIGYTLYYTTNFIFTGLAVALAFHARLFNIGGEGQAYVGGLGVGLVCLIFDQHVVGFLVTILAILGSVIFGAIWGIIPGYLQAKRGSHIVITTIMFNFIAAALMVYLLVNVIIEPGQMSPETRDFASGVGLVQIHILAKYLGLEMAMSPLNLSFIVALTVSVGFWFLVWRTKFGYEVRSLGHSETAAIYAGIKVSSTIIIVMAISGGLAGLVAINELLGVHNKLLLGFTAGYGFTGIAVALMGRNHPVGIFLASLLFGALYQGGTELDFEFSSITREMVLLIQGLIILFSGALAYMLNPLVERIYIKYYGNYNCLLYTSPSPRDCQ